MPIRYVQTPDGRLKPFKESVAFPDKPADFQASVAAQYGYDVADVVVRQFSKVTTPDPFTGPMRPPDPPSGEIPDPEEAPLSAAENKLLRALLKKS
jgi:hypothetical protein